MNEFIRIGDICDILNGYAFKSSKYVADGIRVIRITNVQKGFVEDTNPQYYPVSEQREIEKYMLCEGDLLMSLTGNVGRVGLLSAEMLPAALNQRVACIRIRNPAVIYKPFLFHLLNSDYFENKCILASQGVAQKNMSTEWLKEYPIPSFSMDKQMEIASIFDKIDDLIARRKEQVRNMDQAVKSRFIELFGDPVSNSMGLPTEPMTTVCAIIDGDRGKNYPKQDEFSDTGYCLFLNAKNVTATGFSFENRMFITKEKDDALHNGKLERGDVVLTTRGTLGNLAFYDDSVPFENVRINSGMVILRMKKSVMTEVFFMEQFKLQLQSIKGKIASGSAQPQLPISTMNKIRILLAPMALQEQFAAFVEQTDKSKYYSSLSFRYCQAAANTYRQEWMTCRTSDF